MWRSRRARAGREVFAVVGRDGWLFLGGDSNDVIGQHTGAVEPDGLWEYRWRRIIAGRARLARGVEAEWIHLVIPDKEAVYAEKLPAEIATVPRRPVQRLLGIAARMRAPIVYPIDELRAA